MLLKMMYVRFYAHNLYFDKIYHMFFAPHRNDTYFYLNTFFPSENFFMYSLKINNNDNINKQF